MTFSELQSQRVMEACRKTKTRKKRNKTMLRKLKKLFWKMFHGFGKRKIIPGEINLNDIGGI